MKYKQVRVSEFVDDRLNDIVKQRRETGNLVNTRAGVIAELITKCAKRELRWPTHTY